MSSPDGLSAITAGGRLAISLVADPVEAWFRLRERLKNRQEARRPPCPYAADLDWEPRLHANLGASWPCPDAVEFEELWPEVVGSLRAKGLEIGVGFFAGWNDGEPEIARAIWCLTRHLRPTQVVETGVARGIISRFILEAMERNGSGHLWSIDLPQLLRPELNEQLGVAVEPRLRHRWSYIQGSSRRRLPPLLAELGQIDLFVHDSRHTEYNVSFELERAWGCLRPGSVAVVDDIDLNWGFRYFTELHSDCFALVCPAMPPQQDTRRWNGRCMWGLIRKEVASQSDLAAHA